MPSLGKQVAEIGQVHIEKVYKNSVPFVSEFPCCVCGSKTHGNYQELHVCFDCYESGKLLIWLLSASAAHE